MPTISLFRTTQTCSQKEDAFDNQHGIMAYNRTDQEKGRATKYLPASEWIVSVGQTSRSDSGQGVGTDSRISGT